MMGLFDSGEGEGGGRGGKVREPLAARMRPRMLDEFVRQEQIVGPGARAAARDRNPTRRPR